MSLYNLLRPQFERAFNKLNEPNNFQQIVELMEDLLQYDTALASKLQSAIPGVMAGNKSNFAELVFCLEPFAKLAVTQLTGDWRTIPKYHRHPKVMLSDILEYFHIRNTLCSIESLKNRNDLAHDLPSVEELTELEYAQSRQDALLSYFLVVSARYADLYKKVWDAQLESVIQAYRDRQAAFVDLQVKENVVLMGTEVLAESDARPPRKAAILELRQTISEKAILLLGDAGMGKTTCLMHLAHQDAQSLRQGRNLPIPVYVDLAKFTSREKTILQQVAQQLGKTDEKIRHAFETGRFTLYLDGFNEILTGLVDFLKRDLDALLFAYPQLPVWISSRPVAFEEITLLQPDGKTPVPAFKIRAMDNSLVENFIFKNFTGDKKALWQLLKKPQYKNLLELLRTPLYLGAFLRNYAANPKLPDNNAHILRQFFDEQYTRQKKTYLTFDTAAFDKLLGRYVLKVGAAHGFLNPFVSQQDAIAVLSVCSDSLKLPLAAETVCFHAADMRFWLRSKDHQGQDGYRFAHQLYQDFFKAQAERDILREQSWRKK